MSTRGGSVMRLRGLVRKEFLQIVRDPSSIAIAFIMPVALLLLFGYGLSLDAENVPVAVVAEHPSADTADFIGALEGSRYFVPVALPGIHYLFTGRPHRGRIRPTCVGADSERHCAKSLVTHQE